MDADRHKEPLQAAWERGYDAAKAYIICLLQDEGRKDLARLIEEKTAKRERLVSHTDPRQDEEIKRDYYSGPPGSFTGD